jgi:hypothetical protein
MPLQLLNLRIFQGDSYHLEMSVADFDPMAGSLRAQIRDRWSNPGELYADFVVTAAAGLVILDLDEIFTSNLRATCSPAEMPEGAEAGINLTLDHLNWDLQQDLAGTVKTWRSGKVFVPGEVTLLPGTGPPPSPVDQWLTRAIADTIYAPIGGGGADTVLEVPFSWGDASPKLIGLPVQGLIVSATIAITEAFDGPVELRLGTDATPDLLVPHYPGIAELAESYHFQPNTRFATPQQILLSLVRDPAVTTGQGCVLIDYSPNL